MTGRTPQRTAPVHSLTPAMGDRRIDHGIFRDSSVMADHLAYLVETPKGSLIEIASHAATNREGLRRESIGIAD